MIDKDLNRLKELWNLMIVNIFIPANAAATDIYKLADKAKAFIIENQKPVFIHLECYRYLQHIGTNNDFEESEHIRLLHEI